MQITVNPVGIVRNDRSVAGGGDWDRVNSVIELDLGVLGPDATDGLHEFSHLEVSFTREDSQAANGNGVRRLADRHTTRPNPIATTVCELMGVRPGGVLQVRGLDAADGAKVLDVVPYVAERAPRGDVLQPTWSREQMVGYWVQVPDVQPELDPEAWMAEVRRSPADHGTLELIVARPEVEQRQVLAVGQLDLAVGLVGDNWLARGSGSTADGSANPDAQLNIINARCARLVAGGDGRMALAGDQLHLDLDLSPENLPAGTRLAIGSAVIEITPEPHTGCAKFTRRFGLAAHRWVNGKAGKAQRLRGICAKVVVPGEIRQGDTVSKIG